MFVLFLPAMYKMNPLTFMRSFAVGLLYVQMQMPLEVARWDLQMQPRFLQM